MIRRPRLGTKAETKGAPSRNAQKKKRKKKREKKKRDRSNIRSHGRESKIIANDSRSSAQESIRPVPIPFGTRVESPAKLVRQAVWPWRETLLGGQAAQRELARQCHPRSVKRRATVAMTVRGLRFNLSSSARHVRQAWSGGPATRIRWPARTDRNRSSRTSEASACGRSTG